MGMSTATIAKAIVTMFSRDHRGTTTSGLTGCPMILRMRGVGR
jgi:hypothetical protein